MRRLMLLRHAKAVPQGEMADEDRPLAERGRQDMTAIAAFVATRALIPDLVLVSPALRTRQTWEQLLPAFAAASIPAHRMEPRLYAASADRILYLVQETGAETGAIMLVGHNPGLEDLARLLSGSGETDALVRFGGAMPTSSLAVIDLPGSWTSIEPRAGRLEIFVTPKSLGAVR
jgi:phosphohistidine phosphatase